MTLTLDKGRIVSVKHPNGEVERGRWVVASEVITDDEGTRRVWIADLDSTGPTQMLVSISDLVEWSRL